MTCISARWWFVGDKSRSATPKRAVGLLHLPLGDENRRLALALESPAKVRPNQPLTVKIKASVKMAMCQNRLTCWSQPLTAGVEHYRLRHAGSRQAFSGKNAMARIFMIFTAVIEGQGRLAALRFGGDGDELKRGGKPPVNHVNIVAQQALPVTLNEQAKVR